MPTIVRSVKSYVAMELTLWCTLPSILGTEEAVTVACVLLRKTTDVVQLISHLSISHASCQDASYRPMCGVKMHGIKMGSQTL